MSDNASVLTSMLGREWGALTSRASAISALKAAPSPQPGVAPSPASISKALKVAQEHYYNIEYGRALELLEEATRALQTLPPGKERARLYIDALMQRALVHLGQGREAAADAAFARVLALAPDHTLDPRLFAPSVRRRFEVVRSAVEKAPRVRLDVESSPPGAAVHLDGVTVGVTPWSGALPPVERRLELTSGSRRSFARDLQLAGASARVHVDLTYEGSVEVGELPCVRAEATQEKAAWPLRLARRAGASAFVVLRLEDADRDGAEGDEKDGSHAGRWLRAALIEADGGRVVRDAAVPLPDAASLAPRLPDLARFLLEGTKSDGLRVLDARGQVSRGEPSETTLELTSASSSPPGPDAGPWLRTGAWSATGLAGVLAAAAGVLHLTTLEDRRSIEAESSAGGSALQGADDAYLERLARVDSAAEISNALLIGGAAALTVGGGLFLWELLAGREGADLSRSVAQAAAGGEAGAPERSLRLRPMVGPGGGGVLLQGSF